MRAIVAALFCAGGLGASADAATFYYVSGVYEFSNYERGVSPSFTTGFIDIDESKLPAGQSLAGLRAVGGYWEDDAQSSWPAYIKIGFANQRDSGLYTHQDWGSGAQSWIEFGADGMPENWQIRSFAPNDNSWWTRGAGGAGNDDIVRPLMGQTFVDDPEEHAAIIEQRITDFLEERGYQKGTPAYDRARSAYTWADGYASPLGSGIWTADPLYYALLVQERTREAIANPPSNLYDLGSNPAPVPLPAAAWLLIGGVAALGGLGMRRQARM